jgi:hemerythrin-like domain-containing protein
MSDLPYEGATPEQLRHPLVSHFLEVHDMFRNQLEAVLHYTRDLINGEQQLDAPETKVRIQSLIRAGTQYTYMLHHHHHLETDALFPKLKREGLETSIIDHLNADHDEIGGLIDDFSAAIRNLAAIEPEVMNNDLRRLAEALHNHLAYEETHVCPLLTHFSKWEM